MKSFEERKTGFESKFVHDAETRFKIEARANRLIGLWAANLLGRTGDAADAYASEVMNSDFEEAGREDVFRKLAADLGDKADEAQIRQQMDDCLARAERDIASG